MTLSVDKDSDPYDPRAFAFIRSGGASGAAAFTQSGIRINAASLAAACLVSRYTLCTHLDASPDHGVFLGPRLSLGWPQMLIHPTNSLVFNPYRSAHRSREHSARSVTSPAPYWLSVPTDGPAATTISELPGFHLGALTRSWYLLVTLQQAGSHGQSPRYAELAPTPRTFTFALSPCWGGGVVGGVSRLKQGLVRLDA